jgi:hypothetical protein
MAESEPAANARSGVGIKIVMGVAVPQVSLIRSGLDTMLVPGSKRQKRQSSLAG